MKAFWKDFCLRGLVSAWGGPIVLCIIYAVLDKTGSVTTVTTGEVALGILSITLLAFLVAGMTAIYQVERLPLPAAILIHGAVLYTLYIGIYLVNGWLQSAWIPVLVFTAIFLAGYAIIWALIFLFNKHRITQLNQKLQNK